MKLTQADIKEIEKVGDSPKGEILHITTKGGLNLVVKKSRGGEFLVLGQGPHRSYAFHQADAVEKNIQWNETLYKTEIAPLKKANEETRPESNPQNHYDLASYHSKMAGKFHSKIPELKQLENVAHMEHGHLRNELMSAGVKDFTQTPPEVRARTDAAGKKLNDAVNAAHDSHMRTLFHSDQALKHYQMSGMDSKQAQNEHKKHMDLHHEIPDGHPSPIKNEYDLELAWNLKNRDKPRPVGLGYDYTK